MQFAHALDHIPLWGLFLITFVVSLLSVEIGFRLGRHRRADSENEQGAPIGSMVGATLGLLAFMLAFTFGMAESRFDARKQLVLEEANAVGTAYLRAGLLPEPELSAIRSLLREYVTVRIEGVKSGKIERAIARSEELQDELWSVTVNLAEKNPGSIITGLFIQSLNEVIDLHSKRVTAGLRNRIPGTIWVALYFVTIVAMAAMGYQAGLTATRSITTVIALLLTFSAVLLLIADLDRPQQGLLKVSQQAMVDLQMKLSKPVP